MMQALLDIKTMIGNNFPRIPKLWRLLLNKKEDLKFEGWGMKTFYTSPPWVNMISEDKYNHHFLDCQSRLYAAAQRDDFVLTQFSHVSKDMVLNEINGLMWRHYMVFKTVSLAISTPHSRPVLVELGVCDGLTTFFAMEAVCFNYTDALMWCYDAWAPMRSENLTKDEKIMDGAYKGLSLENTKNNLRKYSDNIVFFPRINTQDPGKRRASKSYKLAAYRS